MARAERPSGVRRVGLGIRGRGLSHPTDACPRPGKWNFDDLARTDVPAAIEHVVQTTGQAVAWVGHSMGGMVLYAYLATTPDPSVWAGVTLASPVVFSATGSRLLNVVGIWLLSVPAVDIVPQRAILGLLWWLLAPTGGLEVGMNTENVDRAAVGRALRLSLSNVSRFKLQQMSQWARNGVFESADRRIDYRRALADVHTPMLVLAGSGDRVAPPDTVRRALDHLPSGAASLPRVRPRARPRRRLRTRGPDPRTIRAGRSVPGFDARAAAADDVIQRLPAPRPRRGRQG